MIKKSKSQRIDDDFAKDLQGAMKTRIVKGLANPMKKEEISIRETTRLARTTNSWKGVLDELRIKPAKKRR